MRLTPASRLGPYEIVAPLGAGGMGEVYRARDTRLGRDIAVKVLSEDVASAPDRLARFEREARTVARLNHPNIVVLHSIEEVSGTRFLTMELVEGRDCTTLVTAGGLPLAQLLDLSIPLADALVAAHENGVVHRDLKPANVMVTPEGRVKVLDFGLAKLTRPKPDQQHTQAPTMTALSTVGEVVGTVPYMAPEQIRGEVVDARTDVFSFGILVYELATGRRPFPGQTFWDVSAAIMGSSPPSLRSVRPDLPADFERIIGRCLEKQPRERFQTALDVLNELRALKLTLERGATPRPEPAEGKVASIAVLPFVNRSGSANDEYFSDGLADELLNVLVKIRGLRVAARTSAFHFKGKDTTIAEVGRALNVATVLEGSVRKAGDRMRISVQLVKVADGYHLWSETYDRTLDDVFAVQDDIAQSVVNKLRTTLLGEAADPDRSAEAKAEVARAAKGRGTNPEAYRLHLLARHLIDRMTADSLARAIDYLRQSLRLDPSFALGWCELGWAHMRCTDVGAVPASEGYGQAREPVERSLELEPDLPGGHVYMALIHMYHDRDWRKAESAFARALELAPGNADVLSGAGILAFNLGRLDEAIGLHRRALEKDPLSSIVHHRLGVSLHMAGRSGEAETVFRRTLELAPQRGGTRVFLSRCLLAQGRRGEALSVGMEEPSEWGRLLAMAMVYHAMEQRAKSDESLQELIGKHGERLAVQIAELYATRGEVDTAFAWLDRACADRDPGVSEVKANPAFTSLHTDPRWRALMRKIGFEE